ncbi:MAG: hypothetical protein EXR72_17305 [Myxococcales bacterium]|nr:hypothetical protein [Myxococcales bacterium]
MREQVVITGLGVVSAAGVTRDAFFSALAEGRSGIAADPAYAASGHPLVGRVGDFGVKQHAPPRALRRLARLSQMALVAAKQAMAQSGLPAPGYDAERVGIVLGTGLGTLRETLDFLVGCHRDGPASGSPLLFPSSVMNAAAGQMALELGLRGVNTTVNHREQSPFAALQVAADLLVLGRADALLVGAVDELHDMAHHGYRRLGGLTTRGMRPYSLGRDGAALGEGSAVMVLERAEGAARRGARVLCRVAGFGAAGEDRPRVGWGRGWTEQALAIRIALDDARVAPGAIDWVAGGGNGLGVDALEARAIAEVFARPVPVSSILGQTGEFMASGALRLAAAIYAIEHQALPGTVGAGAPDPDVPMPGLVRDSRKAPVGAVLLPSLSQGGADAAVVLTRA